MIGLTFKQISDRINSAVLPHFDLVVGIAEGGIVPASLIAYKLGVELTVLKINYRDAENKPIYEQPVILSAIENKIQYDKKILIVDDVSVSGKTLEKAIQFFRGNSVKTLTLKGKANYVLFPEISECVEWPWKLRSKEVAV